MTDLPSDAAIAEALRLSGLWWELDEVKEGRPTPAVTQTLIAFARYIEENAK